jgi:hypothetical protein
VCVSCICMQMGEWESVCTVSGYQGMPSLKIRPKSISRHGRQFVYDAYSRQVVFNIGKVRTKPTISSQAGQHICQL